MIIPNSNRKKALIIVDVQSVFLNNHNDYIVNNIIKLIKNTSYDLYIESIFYTNPNSIWKKQINYKCTKNNNSHTNKNIKKCLEGLNIIKIEKQTKSVFKGDIDILKLLKTNKVEEIHFVGLETNDCILASVYESFDLGFFSYIIEECCDSSTNKLHQEGINILRKVNLTNNSMVENIKKINIKI